MTTDEFILALIAGLPKHEVRGKKRLQKLAFFIKQAGVRCDANFKLWDFGPYSSEIAKAADWLAALEQIEERSAPVGDLNTFMTIYSMPHARVQHNDKLEQGSKEFLLYLDSYSTIELEVAATVCYFETLGLNQDDAIQRTRRIKPTKATPAVLEKSNEILQRMV